MGVTSGNSVARINKSFGRARVNHSEDPADSARGGPRPVCARTRRNVLCVKKTIGTHIHKVYMVAVVQVRVLFHIYIYKYMYVGAVGTLMAHNNDNSVAFGRLEDGRAGVTPKRFLRDRRGGTRFASDPVRDRRTTSAAHPRSVRPVGNRVFLGTRANGQKCGIDDTRLAGALEALKFAETF